MDLVGYFREVYFIRIRIRYLEMYVSDHINGVENARFAGLITRYLGDHIPGVASEGRCNETNRGIGGAYTDISKAPSTFFFD